MTVIWESLKVSRKNLDKLKKIQKALNEAMNRPEKKGLSLDEALGIVLLAGGCQFIE